MIEHGVVRQQHVERRRRHDRVADPLTRNLAEEHLQIERMVQGQETAGFDPGQQHAADTGHVHHRERAQDPIVRVQVEFGHLEPGGGQPLAVGAGYTFGSAGRAGSPADGGSRVRSDRRRLEGRAGLGRGRKDCHLRPQRLGRSGDLIGSVGPVGGDEHLEPGRREPMTQLVRPVLDGERHGHGPHPETCQQGDRQLDHVGELDPDRVGGPDARRLQFSDGTVDASIDLGPCEPLGHAAIERGPIRSVGQRFLVGSRLDGASDQFVDRGGFAHRAMIADVTSPHR